MIHTQIRAFDAVAREGSFSRAARALGVTQPALTIQVRALEEGHGLKLFERQARGVRLTPAGERLFTLSRQLAGLEERIDETLSQSSEEQNGRLRLAVAGPHIVMGLFARLLARHPRVELSVETGNTRTVHQWLLDRRIDVAVVPQIAGHPKVHAEVLWHHRAFLIVARSHRFAGRPGVDLHELQDAPMIVREDGANTKTVVDAALAAQGIRPRVVLELGSREALVAAVAGGLGCGIVWELEALASTRVAAIPLGPEPLISTDYIACLKSERERSIVKAIFAEAARMPANRSDVRGLDW